MKTTPMILRPLLLGLSFAAALTACQEDGPPRIDASNQDKLTASVEKMRSNLSDRQALDQLDNALADVARFSINPAQVMDQATRGRLLTKEEAFTKVKPLVANLTEPELISLAGSMRQKYEAQLAEYEKQLAEMRLRRDQVQKVAEKLARFAVVAADYGKSGDFSAVLGGSAMHLTLTVQNNLDVPIGKAVMMVNFGPADSQTPWFSQRVEKDFEVPLLPGKTAQIEVYNYTGGSAAAPEGVKPVLDAAVVKLSGSDGKVLLSTPQWGPGDTTHMNVLEAAIEHIREQLQTKADPARVPGL